jgi:formimidoylglutamate deiminase
MSSLQSPGIGLSPTSPHALVLPALATAHSHAFQRAMRGSAQRRGKNPNDDFWSWRAEMYRCAEGLTPESFEAVTRVAYKELRRSGVRTVGEFHYIHHQADGTPYSERTLLSDIAIRVAKEEGLRIALLRSAYFRAGPGLPPEALQRRFCDASPASVIYDVESLRNRYAGDSDVVVGLAPHSVRAVPPAFLEELVSYANAHALPLHMHVSEQAREVRECELETGLTPARYLESIGALGPRFVAVHGTQLDAEEARILGRAGAFLCICATTERDLGDGLANLEALRRAEVKLCIGIDSHVITDPIDDLRALETHERLRTHTRVTFQGLDRFPAEQLWFEGSTQTERACGFNASGGTLVIDRRHPILELVSEDRLLDAVVFSGAGHMVCSVWPDVSEMAFETRTGSNP